MLNFVRSRCRLRSRKGVRAPGSNDGAKSPQIPRSGREVSGRRYYNSSQGRFLGRDPLAEKGGLHLYAFTLNNPISRWDLLGMQTEGETREYMGRTYVWHDDGAEGPGWYLESYLWGDGEGVNEFFSNIGFDPSIAAGGTLNRDAPRDLGTIIVPISRPKTVKPGDTYTDSKTGKIYTYSDGGHITVRQGYTGTYAADRAAVNILKQINPHSIEENVEYAGLIQKNEANGTISATVPLTLGLTSESSFSYGDLSLLNTAIGSFHTHSAASSWTDELFSSQDIVTARNLKLTSYLATPSGIFYSYNPASDGLSRYDPRTDAFVPVSARWDSDLNTFIPSGIAPPK